MKRWVIDGAPNRRQVEDMVELLRSGGVILLPTDTIYGLHAVGADERGVARVAKIKGRDEDKRFITLAGTIEQLETLGADVPGVLREIWPAPLTAILRHGQSTLAARVPDLAWLRLMIERTGPLISTSANRSGEPPITSPADLDLKLLKEIDGVADAGRREGKASPIVDFTQTEPRFIREGDPGFTQMLRKRLLKKL